MGSCPSNRGSCGQFPTIQVGILVLMISFTGWQWSWWGVVLVGSCPSGQYSWGFIFIRWGVVLEPEQRLERHCTGHN